MHAMIRHWRETVLIALLCACAIARCASDAAAQIRPDTPLIILVEQDTIVYTPAGERIAIPAGAEIDVCSKNGVRFPIDFGAFVATIPQPCSERPLFADGFEGKRFRRRILPVPKGE